MLQKNPFYKGAIRSTVKLTFTSPVLGTAPGNPDVLRDYITPEGIGEEQMAEEEKSLAAAVKAQTVEEAILKKSTLFHRTPQEQPFLYNYLFRGFFKEVCATLRRLPDRPEKNMKAYKKVVDGTIFVNPRCVLLESDSPVEWLERPLRAQTPSGEFICLARSEMLPAGTTCQLELISLDHSFMDTLHEWLDYGELKGLGQWRNGGFGTFIWEEIS
jgi:hypothetical protein